VQELEAFFQFLSGLGDFQDQPVGRGRIAVGERAKYLEALISRQPQDHLSRDLAHEFARDQTESFQHFMCSMPS
jgi:hypothetical protein